MTSVISAEPTPLPRHSGSTAIPSEATWRVIGPSSRATLRWPITRSPCTATNEACSSVQDRRKYPTERLTLSLRTNCFSATTVRHISRKERASFGRAGRTTKSACPPEAHGVPRSGSVSTDPFHGLWGGRADQTKGGRDHVLGGRGEPQTSLGEVIVVRDHPALCVEVVERRSRVLRIPGEAVRHQCLGRRPNHLGQFTQLSQEVQLRLVLQQGEVRLLPRTESHPLLGGDPEQAGHSGMRVIHGIVHRLPLDELDVEVQGGVM